MNPTLYINLRKIGHNTKQICKLAKDYQIEVVGVSKVLCSDPLVVKTMVENGCRYIGDSKIKNLEKIKNFEVGKVLLRLPHPSGVKDVITNTDLSLNSSIETIRLLNEEAKRQDKKHGVILMIDLGDLREGIFYEDLDEIINVCLEIDAMEHIHLYGIGTNLSCYGGVIPKPDNLEKLVEIKNILEQSYNIPLDVVSGGNSSSLYLLENKTIPDGINHLRVGEGIILGRETAYGTSLPNMYQDAILLTAEIIEIQVKPSYPIGEITMDAFGNIPVIKDEGLMKRAILNIGKQDVQHEQIIPINPLIQVIGSSSDHLILDVTHAESMKVGDLVSFHVNYASVLSLSTSPYIDKKYIY